MTIDYRSAPILGEALAYWNRLRGDRAMPCRRDLDPTDVPRLLPNLQLIEVLEERQRFRYRLVGTALVAAFGSEYTGKYLDELFTGERGQLAHRIFQSVCATCRPMFLRNSYGTTKDVQMVANRLYMPLSEDGLAVNLILGALTFEYGTGAVPVKWGNADLGLASNHVESVDLDAAASV